MPYTPEQVAPILEAATKAGFILVGGQAVNSWSQRFHSPTNDPWETLSPFTSEDVDCYAEQSALPNFIQELESKGFTAGVELSENDREYVHNVALVSISGHGLEMGVNCLRDVIGVSTEELKETARELPVSGTCLLAMHPILCIQSKAHNLAILDQTDRQDEKHLRLSLANLNSYLKQGEEGEDASVCTQIAQRVQELAFSGRGVWIYRNYNINLQDALPVAFWSKSPNPELQKLGAQMEECSQDFEKAIQREVAAEEWMQSKNPNPYKRRMVAAPLLAIPTFRPKLAQCQTSRRVHRRTLKSLKFKHKQGAPLFVLKSTWADPKKESADGAWTAAVDRDSMRRIGFGKEVSRTRAISEEIVKKNWRVHSMGM